MGGIKTNKRAANALNTNLKYHFHTLEDVELLSCQMARYLPQPEHAVLALRELMLNAVEHGNLGISFEEKTRLLRAGTWRSEVERRLGEVENSRKFATAWLEVQERFAVVTIADQGNGFDWVPFLEFDEERSTLPNGRGIAMARSLGFEGLSYHDCGNRVMCRLDLSGQDEDE